MLLNTGLFLTPDPTVKEQYLPLIIQKGQVTKFQKCFLVEGFPLNEETRHLFQAFHFVRIPLVFSVAMVVVLLARNYSTSLTALEKGGRYPYSWKPRRTYPCKHQGF